MKKISSFLIITCFFSLFIACSSDDTGGNDTPEDRVISVAELKAGITIDGATQETGTAPTPNGNLAFQTSTQPQDAFQSTGYEIKFSTNDNIAGAYIQLKDVDGTAVDGYFDVPSSAFQADNKTSRKSKKNMLNKSSKVGEFIIDVDFEDTILPGEFCYEICVYDSEGNISQAQEVCVTVDAWGGNDTLVGEWLFDRYEPAADDDMTTINCLNDQTIEVPYSVYSKNEWTLVLNTDGSYYEVYDEVSTQLDFEASRIDCSAIYGDAIVENNEKYSGFWAFNQEKQTLTIIDFEFEDLVDSSNNQVYDEGEIYFEGVTAEIINNELVLSGEDLEEGETVTRKAIFKRK